MQIQGQYIPAGCTIYNSAAAEETKLLKTGAGLLFSLVVTNFNAAARYIYIFDAVSATGTPIYPPIPLAALGAVGSVIGVVIPYAVPFSTGCYVATSSTGATFTAASSNDIRMSAITK